MSVKATMDPDRLYFPIEIKDAIGLPRNAISAMKNRGCKFFGKKTTIRWVRDFIEKEAAGISTEPALAGAGSCQSERR